MPRKPKSSSKAKSTSKSGSGKSSSYRPTNFSMKNTSLLAVGNAFILSEGKLSRDNIINLSSKTLLGQLKNDGLIVEKSQGIYTTTKKFDTEFAKLSGNERSQGGSGAGEQHSGCISNFASNLPQSALIDGRYKNGNQMITENRQNKKTPEFKNKVNQMKQEVYAAQRQLEAEYNSIKNSSASDLEKTNAEIHYYTEKSNLEMQEKVLNDNKRGVSSPDMSVFLTRAEAESYIENLRELSQSEEYREHSSQWEESISRMESYVSSSLEPCIEICIEVCSGNYRTIDIQSKENWSVVYDKPVFFFDV